MPFTYRGKVAQEKNSAREALFEWHKDNKNDEKDAFLTIIVSLTQTKTSMQVAGFKKLHYQGIGSSAIFFSGLEHQSCYAEDGTMKIAMFCTKRYDFLLNVMNGDNVYPERMLVTRTSMENVPEEYKHKVHVLYLTTDIMQIMERKGKKLLKDPAKLQGITGTYMRMAKWDDATGQCVDRNIFVRLLLNMYNSLKGTKYTTAENDNERHTRNKFQDYNFCSAGIHFMQTFENGPQDPHIDYPWDVINQKERKEIKPVIAFAPLKKEGLMINLWLPHNNSPSIIDNRCSDTTKRYFPYKLMVKYGQIAFLDGDVIHGGGLTPSGQRIHIYMASPFVLADKGNTHYTEGKTESAEADMKTNLLIPPIDRSDYKQVWVKDHINSKFSEPWKMENDKIKKELNSVRILHNLRSNRNIDKLYADDASTIVSWKDSKARYDDVTKICDENRGMYCECPVDEYHERCNNNEMGNCKWKKVFVDES